MQGKTHIVGGLAAGVVYLKFGGTVDQEVLFFGSLVLGALLPDIDHTGSTIGRKVPLVDDIISALFGHRGFTHSLVFLILTKLLFLYTSWPASIELGILIGIFSHMVLDMLTKAGIKFLWPLKWNIGIPGGIKTGGPFEAAFLMLLIVFIAYSGYQMLF